MNLNPSDGNNFGWGEWPTDVATDTYIGSVANSLSDDFVDGNVWRMPANYIAITRHDAPRDSLGRPHLRQSC